MEPKIRLNLGCGFQTPGSWTNVDYSPGARLAKFPMVASVANRLGLIEGSWSSEILVHDLTKPLPFSDGSAEAIYLSHTLEHFLEDDAVRLLEECKRVLKTGCPLRIVVPDLRFLVDAYLRGDIRSQDFLHRVEGNPPRQTSGLKRLLQVSLSFPHRTMFDGASLVDFVNSCGFSDARQMKPLKSSITGIEDVENIMNTKNSVIVEAFC